MQNQSERNRQELEKIEQNLQRIRYPICQFGQQHFQENATQICLDERCPPNIRFQAICNSCTSKRGEHFQISHLHANLGALTSNLIDQIKAIILPNEDDDNQDNDNNNDQQNNNKSLAGHRLITAYEEQINKWQKMSELCEQISRKLHISKENYIQSRYQTIPNECLQILNNIQNLTKESTLDNINSQFREIQKYTQIILPSSLQQQQQQQQQLKTTTNDDVSLQINDSQSQSILNQILQKSQDNVMLSSNILKEFQKKLEELSSMPEIQSYSQIKYQEYYSHNARLFGEKCLTINTLEDSQSIQPHHELLIIKNLENNQGQNIKKIIELLESNENQSFLNLSGINLILPQKSIRELNNNNDSSNELLAQLLKPVQKIIQNNSLKDFGVNIKNWSKCTQKSSILLSEIIKSLIPSANQMISFSLNLQSLFHFEGESFSQLLNQLKEFGKQTSKLSNFSLNMSRLVNLTNLEFYNILEFIEIIVTNNQNIHLFDLNLALIQNINDDGFKKVGDILQTLSQNNKTISTLKLNFMGWQGISDKNAIHILQNLENLVMSNNLFKTFTLDIQNWEQCTDQSIEKMNETLKTLISFCRTLEEFNINMSYWKLGSPKQAKQLSNTLIKLAQSNTLLHKFNLDFYNWSDSSVEIFEQLQSDLQEYFNSNNNNNEDE